jgi:hypothetical protein
MHQDHPLSLSWCYKQTAGNTILWVWVSPAEVLYDVANPVYVSVSADWVLPVAANDHMPPSLQWFEYDASELFGAEKSLGQAVCLVESLSSQVQALELAMQNNKTMTQPIAAHVDQKEAHPIVN